MSFTRLRSLTIGFLSVALLFSFGMLFVSPVSASGDREVCPVSNSCPDPKINLECQRAKLVNPLTSCNICLCGGEAAGHVAVYIPINLFGVAIRINSDQALSQLVHLGFMAFLGVIAFATIGLGAYAAIKRSQAETDDEIANAQKTMTNAIVGFVLVVISMVIAQLVASFLGISSITQISVLDSDLIEENDSSTVYNFRSSTYETFQIN